MRKAEQKVWDAMRRANLKRETPLWLQRVENLMGDGMPDVYAGGPWIELKAGRLPKRATTRIQYSEGLRQSQVNWHKKAWSKGVASYVLVRVEERKSEPCLVLGLYADKINDWTWDELSRYAKRVGWSAILDWLEYKS